MLIGFSMVEICWMIERQDPCGFRPWKESNPLSKRIEKLPGNKGFHESIIIKSTTTTISRVMAHVILILDKLFFWGLQLINNS